MLVFLTLEKKPEQKTAPAPAQPPKVRSVSIVSLEPPPQGFQAVKAPIAIPTDIPPIDFGERFDPRDFSGIGVEGGVFDGVKGGTGSVDASRLYRVAALDERPERISGPQLRYPESLRQTGIGGYVILDFVIDTTGHVAPSSITVVESSYSVLERPAKDVIRKSLYRTGRVRGVAVRVLVRQRFDFTFAGRQQG